eukprot:jgi/Galph1/3203/GphlegSOOS_G1839.1
MATNACQQVYYPYEGIVLVKVPRQKNRSTATVQLNLKEAIEPLLNSPVLSSTCCLRHDRKTDTTQSNKWLQALEHMKRSNYEKRLSSDNFCKSDNLRKNEFCYDIDGTVASCIDIDKHSPNYKAETTVEKRNNTFIENTESRQAEQKQSETLKGLDYPDNKQKFTSQREVSYLQNNSSKGRLEAPLFSTGSGRAITSSTTCLERAKRLLCDLDVDRDIQASQKGICEDTALHPDTLSYANDSKFDGSDNFNSSVSNRHSINSIFTTGKGVQISISPMNLQRASTILEDSKDTPLSPKHLLNIKQRNLSSSLVKKARRVLCDAQTPNRPAATDNSSFYNGDTTPLLRSYPDSLLPMKRTPSGITDSVFKRRDLRKKKTGETMNLENMQDRPYKKRNGRISLNALCQDLQNCPVNNQVQIKKVTLRELYERKRQTRTEMLNFDRHVLEALKDPINYRIPKSRFGFDTTISISSTLPGLSVGSDGKIGLDEFIKHLRPFFADATGPTMKVGTNLWIRNAFRLLIWKLASLEQFYAPLLHHRLNVLSLVIEFSKRLEQEWNLGKRSILQRIAEGDSLVGSHFIVFISDILPDNFIEISDGWYCLQAKIDSFLSHACSKGKIFKGCKISVCSSTIYRRNEDNPEETILSLHYNGIRRVAWYSKLGERRYPPVLHTMSNLYSGGGQIPCVEVIIERSFPTRFVEKETLNGSEVRKMRNEEDEERINLRGKERVAVRLDEIFQREDAQDEFPRFPDLERDVSRMTEILALDVMGRRRAYVTFWRPTNAIIELLQHEGYIIRLYGIICCQPKNTRESLHHDTLYLTVPSKMPVRLCVTSCPTSRWVPRHVLSGASVPSLAFNEEFDSVFIVLLVGDVQQNNTRFVYLSQTNNDPITAVKFFEEQTQSLPNALKRATSSSKMVIIAVKNLKFAFSDKRCDINFCHQTTRCVWLSSSEAKVCMK